MLKNVSFRIEKGQLCVIVGVNGSGNSFTLIFCDENNLPNNNFQGKSTLLKLILRLYEPIDGEILIDDMNIKTLKIDDLRRAASVLFQDYTIFPLSVTQFQLLF